MLRHAGGGRPPEARSDRSTGQGPLFLDRPDDLEFGGVVPGYVAAVDVDVEVPRPAVREDQAVADARPDDRAFIFREVEMPEPGLPPAGQEMTSQVAVDRLDQDLAL